MVNPKAHFDYHTIWLSKSDTQQLSIPCQYLYRNIRNFDQWHCGAEFFIQDYTAPWWTTAKGEGETPSKIQVESLADDKTA